jgi:uncharacterized protein YjbI with pentapeptide repeats
MSQSVQEQPIIGPGANLVGIDLSFRVIIGVNLMGANLRRVNLEESNLEGANLEGANLKIVNLYKANLTDANLNESSLKQSNLSEAILIRATLIDADLQNVDLRRADLTRANLIETNLQRADLTRTNLTSADLTGADLTGANLTEANLQRADLTRANLTRANLTGADLTGADLTGADLTGAILTRAILTNVILSDLQREQIEASNLAREQQQLADSAFPSSLALLNQSISASADYPALTFSRNQYGRIINIPPELLKPKNNSANKSCPSFMPLYKQVMVIDLDGSFRFQFQGQNSHDLTGLTRIVFDKLLPVYTNLFFRKSGEFMLLKENVDMDLLNQHTNQIIKLAKAANAQIQLEINPELIEFLSLENPRDNIGNNQNFNNLYASFKAQINLSGNNVSNYLLNNSLKPEINAAKGNLNAVSRALKKEILFRKTLNGFGFTSFDQYHNMAVFIKTFWNTSNKITAQKQGREVRLDLFVPKLEFDVESFTRRIKIIREDPREVLDLSSIPESLKQIYPAFGPLLEYILNPSEDANENRKTFVKYATGTEYSPAEIIISLTNTTMQRGLHNGQALYGHSCSSQIDLYMAPRNYNGVITGNNINTQLKATVSNKSNVRVAER